MSLLNAQSAAVVVTALIAVTGWVVSHQFSAWRDRLNDRRKQRITYLVSAYQSLARAVARPHLYEANEDLRNALASIQILGTDEQIKLARQFAHDLGGSGQADLEPLLVSLRDDLRSELGVEKVIDSTFFMTWTPDPKDSEEKKEGLRAKT